MKRKSVADMTATEFRNQKLGLKPGEPRVTDHYMPVHVQLYISPDVEDPIIVGWMNTTDARIHADTIMDFRGDEGACVEIIEPPTTLRGTGRWEDGTYKKWVSDGSQWELVLDCRTVHTGKDSSTTWVLI